MNTAMPVQQRGLSFGGFIFGAFLLVLVSITGLKVIPAYIQNAQIKRIFTVIAHDPDMKNASPREIRVSFERRASIDNITAIKAEEIEIVSGKGNLELSASYSVKIPLVANISLYIEFNPSTDN